jgi:hypothetical protein
VPLLSDPLEPDDNDADHQAPTDMFNDIRLCEELFHTSSGVAYADFMTDGHREIWPIRSKRFRTWLRRCYYRATGPHQARRYSARRSIYSKRARNLMAPSG